MRVLVTGATGFIGSHLVPASIERGDKVTVLARPQSRLPWDESICNALEVIRFAGTAADLSKVLSQLQPELVYHLATSYSAEHNPAQIEGLIAGNLLFGTQLLEAMTQAQVKYLVNVSTMFMHYGGHGYNPINLYAATKKAFEDIALYYAETDKINCANLKIFDTYGPCDERGKLIPFLLRDDPTRGPIAMSPGQQMMDILHVDDVVGALIIAAQLLVAGDLKNFEEFFLSSGVPMTVRELVATVARAADRSIPVTWGAKQYREREMMTLPTHGRRLPGWHPRIFLEAGIKALCTN